MSSKATSLQARRVASLRHHVITEALAAFDAQEPNFAPSEAVVLVCAYEEEGAIGEVLAKIPEVARARTEFDEATGTGRLVQ